MSDHSVFNVIVTSQTKLIIESLVQLHGYLSLNCRLPMPEFSDYHAAHEYYKTKN